ncbi:MAG: deoxyribodipyrimidine photo-lyase [Mariniblastus sp.]
MATLVWFRRDLRVLDNTALYQACKAKDGVVGVFVITPQQWLKHDDAPCKIKFWLDNLKTLSESLAKFNIPLQIKICDTFESVPDLIVKTAEKFGCSKVVFNREYEVYETRRDAAVSVACESAGIKVQRFHDRVVIPPRDIKTKDGRFYSVFTPYRKVWDTIATDHCEPLGKPAKQPKNEIKTSKIPTKIEAYDLSDELGGWTAGEPEAAKRLAEFAKRIADYNVARDVPSEQGTSQLSPYLVAGVISPRQCMKAALECRESTSPSTGEESTLDEGIRVWISELAWRDFYSHVMVGFPRVSMHQPFKEKTTAIKWRSSKADFEAWSTGQTGYPIVDAGMRQLNQTGWMHNRLRMVTAMFLTKHLLIDWRLGEQYFMQHLIDGDLAANNGGWQWSASTGTDSVPYFRIFNPFSQSKRFDTKGVFIKQMCPELSEVPASSLHDPGKLTTAIKGTGYPNFIVDHKSARERTLAEFKRIG